MNDNDNDNEECLDFGTPLLAMAQDAPPPATVPDIPPTPGSPVDAALAALYAACNESDAANDRAAVRLWGERQSMYRDAINGGGLS
jgi:hypothetical protein